MSDGRWLNCFSCNESIYLRKQVEETLRRNQGDFYCLWGHKQHFPAGQTSTQKAKQERDELRRERDRLAQRVAQKDDEIRTALATAEDQRRRAAAARGQVTRLKNRAANGVCPCCNRSFSDLRRHMATKHSGFLAEEVQANHGTIQ